jgi:hypothetical protein
MSLAARLLLAAAVPVEQGASTRRLCARSATLRDSPQGFVIGRLYRPQRLRYFRRNADRMLTDTGATGWVRAEIVGR